MSPETAADLTAALRSRDAPLYEGTPIDIGVPAHLTLALAPGAWGPRPGQLAESDRYADIRPVRTYRARGADGYVIVGHTVLCECTPGTDEVCHLVWVTSAGLDAAVARVVVVPVPAPEA